MQSLMVEPIPVKIALLFHLGIGTTCLISPILTIFAACKLSGLHSPSQAYVMAHCHSISLCIKHAPWLKHHGSTYPHSNVVSLDCLLAVQVIDAAAQATKNLADLGVEAGGKDAGSGLLLSSGCLGLGYQTADLEKDFAWALVF